MARGKLDKPDGGQHQGQANEHGKGAAGELLGPTRARDQDKEQREGHVEEDDILKRRRAAQPIGALKRVDHQHGSDYPLERSRPEPLLACTAAQPRKQPCQRAGGHHQVEAEQETRGRITDRNRNPERQRQHDGDWESGRPPREENYERSQSQEADQHGGNRQNRTIAQRRELVRVGDVNNQNQRRENERRQHQPRARRRRANDESRAGQKAADC